MASTSRQCSADSASPRSSRTVHQIDDWAEDIELDLAVGGVADPNRSAAAVAGKIGDLGLRGKVAAGHVVERGQPLRVGPGLQQSRTQSR